MSDDFKNAEIAQESETSIDTDSYVFWYGELSLQLRQYKQAFEKQNAQFAKMNEAFQRNAQDMSVLTTENAGLKKADSETRKLLREKDVEIGELNRQIQILKPQADRCSTEAANAYKLVEQVNTLTAERNRLDVELKTSIQVREQQSRKLQEQAQAMIEGEKLTYQLRETYSDQEKTIEELRARVAELETELSQGSAKIESLESEILKYKNSVTQKKPKTKKRG